MSEQLRNAQYLLGELEGYAAGRNKLPNLPDVDGPTIDRIGERRLRELVGRWNAQREASFRRLRDLDASGETDESDLRYFLSIVEMAIAELVRQINTVAGLPVRR